MHNTQRPLYKRFEALGMHERHSDTPQIFHRTHSVEHPVSAEDSDNSSPTREQHQLTPAGRLMGPARA
jgi:hypothetical protein